MDVMDENSCKHVNSIICQTSEETKYDTHDGKPRTPRRDKARTCEEGDPSSIQTQENPDPQFLKTMSEEKQPLIGNMIPMILSEGEKTVCSPSDDNEAMRQSENKQSVTVPDREEEPPVDMLEEKLKLGERNKILEQHCQVPDIEEEPPLDMLEENFKLRERIKILEQHCQVLFESNKVKDEELRLKDEEINKEKNLQAKHDEDMKKIKEEYARLEEDVKKTKDEKARLEEVPDIEEEPPLDMLKEKLKLGERIKKLLKIRKHELFRLSNLKDEEFKDLKTESPAIIERLQKQIKNLQADNKELKDEKKKINKELEELNMVKYEKTRLEEENERLEDKITKLEDENERLEEEGREEYEEGNEMIKTQMEITEELEKELVIFKICKICLESEKDIVILPCGHFGVCQKCYEENYQETDPCPFCRQKIENHVKVYHQ